MADGRTAKINPLRLNVRMLLAECVLVCRTKRKLRQTFGISNTKSAKPDDKRTELIRRYTSETIFLSI